MTVGLLDRSLTLTLYHFSRSLTAGPESSSTRMLLTSLRQQYRLKIFVLLYVYSSIG